jgi:hypothetical protein
MLVEVEGIKRKVSSGMNAYLIIKCFSSFIYLLLSVFSFVTGGSFDPFFPLPVSGLFPEYDPELEPEPNTVPAPAPEPEPNTNSKPYFIDSENKCVNFKDEDEKEKFITGQDPDQKE